MNDQEIKLKLRESEVVHADTFELAAKIGILADSLGLRLCTISYLEKLNWKFARGDTCYDLHSGGYGSSNSYKSRGETIISATEWLNRHGVFVFGQEVLVKQYRMHENSYTRRIFLHGNICVTDGYEDGFRQDNYYKATRFHCIKSTFPRWRDKPEQVPLILDGEEILISKESADALKQKFRGEK